MDELIVAAEGCDPAVDVICTPADVSELFVFDQPIAGIEFFTRTTFLMMLAALIVVGLLYIAFRKPKLIPGKFQAAMEALVGAVRDGVARDVIGAGSEKYVPYLLSVFLLVLVGNLFEITPLINFPITSRMALPAFLALLTWLIFVIEGIRVQGFAYFGHLLWPPGVPIALKPLVGIIEFVSTILVRPFSLAVRLFANLVAGHVMLSLLLASGFIFLTSIGDIGIGRGAVGLGWFILGLAIFVFEILVAILQAYIFTLLSAVYIQTSIHPEH